MNALETCISMKIKVFEKIFLPCGWTFNEISTPRTGVLKNF